MKALKPDFLTTSNEHIKVLTRPQFCTFIQTMKPGEEAKLYIEIDRSTRTAEYAIAIRKESWNDSIYYQIGGFGYMITTINFSPENTEEDFTDEVSRALDSFDISDEISVAVAETSSLDNLFYPQLNQMRKKLIDSIVSILKENNLMKIDLDGIIPELIYVVWHDDDGEWHDSPIVAVSLHEEGIAIDVADTTDNIEETLYNDGTNPVAFNNFYWLDGIRDNILEAIEATRNIQNDTQRDLLKKWNSYLNENSGNEPSFANVSIRYKNGTIKNNQTISLIELSNNDADLILHNAKSLQELITLAAPNIETSTSDFIITNLNYFSESFEEPETTD